MIGYTGHAQTDRSKYRGDWFLTQDLVSMDDEGYLTYYGRADTVIKVGGGFRVSPIEIENVLKLHKDIIDAACGSVYDDKRSEDILTAYIVVRDPTDALAKKVFSYASAHLSDYKVPHHIIIVDHLPYNSRGKLMRNQLHQLPVIKSFYI